MRKSSLSLAVLSAVLTVSAISPAFANPQILIAPNALQRLNGGAGSAAFGGGDDYCGTRVPGFPPRPHWQLQTAVQQNPGILTIGPKQDDPAGTKFNSQLGSTGVGNPGVLTALNPQPLPPQSCANLK